MTWLLGIPDEISFLHVLCRIYCYLSFICSRSGFMEISGNCNSFAPLARVVAIHRSDDYSWWKVLVCSNPQRTFPGWCSLLQCSVIVERMEVRRDVEVLISLTDQTCLWVPFSFSPIPWITSFCFLSGLGWCLVSRESIGRMEYWGAGDLIVKIGMLGWVVEKADASW